MEIPVELTNKIALFLQDIPLVNSREERLGFLLEAGLDQSLLHLISCDGAITTFFQQLVHILLQYGQIQDGRYALQAVLETAKNRIGQDKQLDCDVLLQRWREYQNVQARLQDNQPQIKDSKPEMRSTSFPLRIMVTGGIKSEEHAQNIAYSIGQYAIFRDHLMISNGAAGIDEAACKGAWMACQVRDFNPTNIIHIFRPKRHPAAQIAVGHIEIIGETYEERRTVVVEQSHAVIVLSGGKGTKHVVRQAQIMKKPIIPIKVENEERMSTKFWHIMYNQMEDSLPYIPIGRENLQKIDATQENTESIALAAIRIAESLVYGEGN